MEELKLVIPFIIVLFIHFIADFVFQTDWQAKNKSSSFKALGMHSLTYTLPFLFIGWEFALFNGVCHFVIDGISSRINKYWWNKNNSHNFFIGVGFDQFLHTSSLLLSYAVLL